MELLSSFKLKFCGFVGTPRYKITLRIVHDYCHIDFMGQIKCYKLKFFLLKTLTRN
jgi:hypothetical protein